MLRTSEPKGGKKGSFLVSVHQLLPTYICCDVMPLELTAPQASLERLNYKSVRPVTSNRHPASHTSASLSNKPPSYVLVRIGLWVTILCKIRILRNKISECQGRYVTTRNTANGNFRGLFVCTGLGFCLTLRQICNLISSHTACEPDRLNPG